MLVAIPFWQGRVSPVFDSARKLALVQIENGTIVGRNEVLLEGTLPPHRVEQLVKLGVEILVCGSISRTLTTMCRYSGITIFAWVSGPLEEVIQAYIAGTFPNPAYTMPGCRGRRFRARRRRGRGRNRDAAQQPSGVGGGQGRQNKKKNK